MDATVKEDTWHVVLKGCETSVRELVGVIRPLDANTTLNRESLVGRRNATKMHAYLLCQMIEMFENDANAEAGSSASTKVGKGRGKVAALAARGRRQESHISIDWIAECSSAITVLDQLCKLDIQQLWDPPVVEEDFVKYVWTYNATIVNVYWCVCSNGYSFSVCLQTVATNSWRTSQWQPMPR